MKKKSVVHIYLYGMFKREVCGGNLIHISKINPVLKWAIRIPKKYRIRLIHEFIELGLMKKKGRDNYELLTIKNKCPTDSLGDPLW